MSEKNLFMYDYGKYFFVKVNSSPSLCQRPLLRGFPNLKIIAHFSSIFFLRGFSHFRIATINYQLINNLQLLLPQPHYQF
jgi:hypothetical protein